MSSKITFEDEELTTTSPYTGDQPTRLTVLTTRMSGGLIRTNMQAQYLFVFIIVLAFILIFWLLVGNSSDRGTVSVPTEEDIHTFRESRKP